MAGFIYDKISMLNFGRNSSAFFISFFLSIIFHFTFVSWLSGYKGLSFPATMQNQILAVNLEKEISIKAASSSRAKPPLSAYSHESKDIEEDAYTNNIKNVPVTEDRKESEMDSNAIINTDMVQPLKEAITIKSSKPEIKPNTKVDGDILRRETHQAARYTWEKLSFDIYWLGIYAGNAVLESSNENGMMRIITQVHSAPFVSAFYKVEDYIESLVKDGMPSNLRIRQREGRYKSDKETLFDMKNKKVTFFNYLKGNRSEHALNNEIVWDLLSGFYYLRDQRLEVGKTVYIDVFDSNKFFKAEITVLRKEKIDVPNLGEVSTVIVKPELKSEGLFQRTGDILIWLTDDEKKIPVKVETKVPVGNIVANLSNMEIR